MAIVTPESVRQTADDEDAAAHARLEAEVNAALHGFVGVRVLVETTAYPQRVQRLVLGDCRTAGWSARAHEDIARGRTWIVVEGPAGA